MNKKQFATKLIASMLSAYFLVPCTSTFGVDSQPESEEAVSLSEKNQEALNDEDTQESEDAQEDENKQKSEDTQKVKDKKKGQKKTILRNPYVQVVGGGIGLGALIFGGSRLWKRFSSGRHPQSPTDGGSVTPPAAPVEPQTLPEDRSGWNELHHAAEGDQARLANLLDMSLEDKRRYFGERDALGRTPLYIAYKYGNRFFLDHFHNEYNFEQLYRQSPQEMYNFFIFDVLCTAARLNDVHTLSHLREAIRSTFAYRKASTDPHDYSLLNMALAHGAQIAHERSLNLGITELGYSLLDIALRHNARNAATYLMGQGVVFEMNNIFGNAAFTPEDKLAFLNFLADHGYDFTGTNGHEPFNVRLVFGDATLAPENKLEILNFLAEHGRRFANDDDRRNFIDLILTDPVLSEDNKRVILRSLKDHGFDFKINGERRPTISNACIQLFAAAAKNYGTLINFYIEDCNALSYMDGSDRNRIQRMLANKQELLTYFNQKCSEQLNAPIAQPDATAAGASTQPGAPNAQPGTMAAGEGSGSETTTEGTPPNQGHTTGSSDAQPRRPLTREEMRAQQLAALARRRNNNT